MIAKEARDRNDQFRFQGEPERGTCQANALSTTFETKLKKLTHAKDGEGFVPTGIVSAGGERIGSGLRTKSRLVIEKLFAWFVILECSK